MFGFIGAVLAWRTPRYHPLIPLQVATVILIVLAAKWWDWFGGTTWGYRSIVDVAPFLALSIIPIIERVMANRRVLALFCVLLLWSVAVQFVGAWSYSLIGWTKQWEEYDNPDKASLWQWTRPQITYHVANFKSERALKQRIMKGYVNNKAPILNVPPPELPPSPVKGGK